MLFLVLKELIGFPVFTSNMQEFQLMPFENCFVLFFFRLKTMQCIVVQVLISSIFCVQKIKGDFDPNVCNPSDLKPGKPLRAARAAYQHIITL